MSEFLYDDIFKIEDLDPDGKKYDKGMLLGSQLLSSVQF